MSIPVRQSTAFETSIGPVLDADGVAFEGAVVGDFQIKKTSGDWAALNASATATHTTVGHYDLVLTASDVDTVGVAAIRINDGVNACATLYLQVIEEAVYDDLYAASAVGYPTAAEVVNEWETQSQADPTGFHVNVLEVGGTAQTAFDIGGQIGAAGAGLTEAGGTGDHLTSVPDTAGTTTLLSRIPAALFSGITSLAQWLGLLAGKQSGNATARTELRATGAGSGTFDETADSLEAVRDRGDAAWITATGFSTFDPTSDAVFLRDGAHGGMSAVLTAERIIVASTTSNEPAVKLNGNGTAAGLSAEGGATGHGILACGGATSGAGALLRSAGGFISYDPGEGDGMALVGSAGRYGLYSLATLFDAFTVAGATTLTGNVSLGGTLTVTGATSLAALSMTTLTASGAVALQSTLIVTGATTFTGAVTATNASNSITGVGITSNVKKNQSLATFTFLMTDSTNHEPATGLTVTCTRSIDGAAFAAGTLANVAEVANGVYSVDFGAGDLNGNTIILKATATGADTTFERIITQP